MKRRASPAAQGKAMLLWPFGVLIALAAFPIIWLLLAVIFWMTNRWVDWPTSGTSGGLLYLAVAVVLVPIVLLILDAVARGGGSFTVKSVGINFGSGVRATEPPAVEVQTSLGFEGQPINDSMVASVHQTLNEARANDIVRIDLGVRRQLVAHPPVCTQLRRDPNGRSQALRPRGSRLGRRSRVSRPGTTTRRGTSATRAVPASAARARSRSRLLAT
jgi:hypothetical protein